MKARLASQRTNTSFSVRAGLDAVAGGKDASPKDHKHVGVAHRGCLALWAWRLALSCGACCSMYFYLYSINVMVLLAYL